MKKAKQKRLLFVGTIFAISILALFFVFYNFRQNIVFFYAPTELHKLAVEKKAQKTIRVGGLVKKDSVKKISNLEIEFAITDLKEELVVNYRGLTPNLFREGQGVIAKGNFDQAKNMFFAKELLVKHDEKYMPPEVKNSLKN